MARFARDCLEKMGDMVLKLEVTLGPDTADLAMRVGLHSGPVTAGVLRGERARFQLFGDTVNTAARMESTGIKTKIQISQQCAELIIASGKSSWIKPREDIIFAKGKGELKTFWLLPKNLVGTVSTYSPSEGVSEAEHIEPLALVTETEGQGSEEHLSPERIQRLVEYNCDILLQILKKVVAKRAQSKTNITSKEDTYSKKNLQKLEDVLGKTGNCLKEVAEVIHLPKFDSAAYNDFETVEVSKEVVSQLSNYVETIASMYRNNRFHNFDHASHVTQSTSKLVSRIVACKEIEKGEQMHDHTYGITDPLTQFAVMFASLIHDVDHRGVPNFLLIKEDPSLGAIYNNQAVAEQNSMDVAWNLLMDPAFGALRRAIYRTESEMRRFRQVVVNGLMATEIFDKELSTLRKNRWQKAFHAEEEKNPETAVNRKATIVIEHIIHDAALACLPKGE
jgi:hypothetical protein